MADKKDDKKIVFEEEEEEKMTMEVGLKIQPKIVVNEKVNRKMETIIDMVDSEVGWMGLVEQESPGVFRLLDVYILKQEVNGGTTEIDSQDLARLSDELYDNGTITEDNQDKRGLYFWGHSHDTMSPSPSGQDNTQFKYLYDICKPPFFIRLIQNKRRERTVALYIADPGSIIQDYMIIRGVDWEIDSKEITEMRESLEKVIKDKVKTKEYKTTTVYTHSSPYNYSNYNYGSYKDYKYPKSSVEECYYEDDYYGGGTDPYDCPKSPSYIDTKMDVKEDTFDGYHNAVKELKDCRKQYAAEDKKLADIGIPHYTKGVKI